MTRMIASDFVFAALALGPAYWFRYHFFPKYIPGGEAPDPLHYAVAAPVAALCVVGVFALQGLYRRRRGVPFIDELVSILGAMAISGLAVFALIGLYREEHFAFSRITFLYWLAASTALVSAARYGLRRYEARLDAAGAGKDRAVIIGCGEVAELLVHRIRMFPEYGYTVVGILADDRRQGSEFEGLPVVAPVSDLRETVQRLAVDTVFVAQPSAGADQVHELVDRCRDLDVEFRFVPGMVDTLATQLVADQLGGIPLLRYRRGLALEGPAARGKRIFDVIASALAMVVLLPLILLVGLVVRLSSRGPVLLHQERVGIHGRPFIMHKFRTMRTDAEMETGPVWAVAGDARRTPVGRVLRRLSLDELPQLWNVLKGEMSLVGPRPERRAFVDAFVEKNPHYADRLRVHPGLTGWAQVNDMRGQTPIESRLIYDMYYVENWSLFFDLKIILMTAFRIFSHRSAY